MNKITVKQLKRLLNNFNDDLPVVIREVIDSKYTCDWNISDPEEFYPGGKVCLMRTQQHLDFEVESEVKENY
jgi:hypothetical protein